MNRLHFFILFILLFSKYEILKSQNKEFEHYLFNLLDKYSFDSLIYYKSNFKNNPMKLSDISSFRNLNKKTGYIIHDILDSVIINDSLIFNLKDSLILEFAYVFLKKNAITMHKLKFYDTTILNMRLWTSRLNQYCLNLIINQNNVYYRKHYYNTIFYSDNHSLCNLLYYSSNKNFEIDDVFKKTFIKFCK